MHVRICAVQTCSTNCLLDTRSQTLQAEAQAEILSATKEISNFENRAQNPPLFASLRDDGDGICFTSGVISQLRFGRLAGRKERE